METKPKFPDHRLTDLKRQAELAIYRSIQASALPGMAVYGQRPGPSGPELDFAIWLQNVARMTLEVKGGDYTIEGCQWFLAGPGGSSPKPNPLFQAWDGAMALRSFIGERLGTPWCPFVLAAVVFPDMAPDPGIEAATAGSQVKVLWGADDVAERMAAIAAEVGINYPPTPEDIRRESGLLVPARERQELAAEGLDGRQVIIRHVEHLHIHTASVDAPEMAFPSVFRPGG